MYRITVAIIILALVGCDGGKPASADKAAVEQYVNHDMNALIGVFWAGKRPLEKISVDAIDQAPGWFKRPGGLDQIVIPRMTEFIEAATKVTPPAPMAAAHALLIEIATSHRAVATQMIEAVEAGDKPKFSAAHATLMETTTRYTSWMKMFDAALDRHGVRLNDPPHPPPYPTAP